MYWAPKLGAHARGRWENPWIPSKRMYIRPICSTLCWNPGISVVSPYKPEKGPTPQDLGVLEFPQAFLGLQMQPQPCGRKAQCLSVACLDESWAPVQAEVATLGILESMHSYIILRISASNLRESMYSYIIYTLALKCFLHGYFGALVSDTWVPGPGPSGKCRWSMDCIRFRYREAWRLHLSFLRMYICMHNTHTYTPLSLSIYIYIHAYVC